MTSRSTSATHADAHFIATLLSAVVLGFLPGIANAQSVAELFGKVASTVVVVRAQGPRAMTGDGSPTSVGEVGSGVVISGDGRIMTAAHLVHGSDAIVVQFLGGRTVRARVVAAELAADLSLLQLDQVPPGLVAATLANSDAVRVGEQVIVVGAPYGLAHALSVGWISARWAPSTVYKAIPLAEFFQTDASINTGNSGGPMFNMAAEVIGIVSHVISKSGGSEGLGFVVTMNTAKQLLLDRRSIWSGLDGQLLSDELADLFNLPPKTRGFLVKTAAKGSPGEVMGIKGGRKTATIDGQPMVVGGDIILKVEGVAVTTAADLAQIRVRTSRLAEAAPVTVTVLRAGRQLTLIGKMP
jgi:serine protease Do